MNNIEDYCLQYSISESNLLIDIKNYTFTSQKIDNDKLKEMHKAKYS